jgi:ribosomal protein S18 acetylase RimI-like enzyme
VRPAPPPLSSFRGLRADEVDRAYDLYLGVCAWLKQKGVRQWLLPKPRSKFDERQERGENYGLFLGTDLAAIVTLGFEVHEKWPEELGPAKRWWLHTLAAAPEFRGRRLGEATVTAAIGLLRTRGVAELFLDCDAGGILPAYYRKLGFVTLAQKPISFPSGNAVLIELMSRRVSPPPG